MEKLYKVEHCHVDTWYVMYVVGGNRCRVSTLPSVWNETYIWCEENPAATAW